MFHALQLSNQIEIRGQFQDEESERQLRIGAIDISTDDGLELLPIDGNGGIFSVSPEVAFGGLHLKSTDARGNQLSTKTILVSNSGELTGHVSKRSDVIPATLLSARIYPNSSHEAGQLSVILRMKQELEVLDALRIIEPAVERIEVLSEPDGSSIYLDVGLNALVPLGACGDGMVRLLSIILALIASRNGVLLVDEIDSGLHDTVIPDLWRLLDELAGKHSVQVFGTTHNEEITRAALDSFNDKEGTLGLFRINKLGDRHVMVGYDEAAMEAVRELHFDVRG